jgi:hypothetical protein
MKYFNHFDTLEALKTEYRRLAMENHPDHGGDSEAMKEINAEFDLAFHIIEKKVPKPATETETPAEYRRYFYTQYGWEGSRYNPKLSLRDIAPLIRGYVKDVYPTWKFSVRTEYYSMGCSLHISVTEAPAELFNDAGIMKLAIVSVWKRHFNGSEEEAFTHYKKELSCGYIQTWDWYYDYMTDVARNVLSDVEALVNSYRYNDSDSQIDYFDTNFYPHFSIGKWDKPLKIVPKRERIQTNKGPEKARRITG